MKLEKEEKKTQCLRLCWEPLARWRMRCTGSATPTCTSAWSRILPYMVLRTMNRSVLMVYNVDCDYGNTRSSIWSRNFIRRRKITIYIDSRETWREEKRYEVWCFFYKKVITGEEVITVTLRDLTQFIWCVNCLIFVKVSQLSYCNIQRSCPQVMVRSEIWLWGSY